MLQDCLRAHHIIQRLLSRDMRRQKLSLRQAARQGRIALGTLSFILDRSRVHDPDKRPKRGLRRGTLLVLREMPWVGGLSATTLERLIVAKAQRSSGL